MNTKFLSTMWMLLSFVAFVFTTTACTPSSEPIKKLVPADLPGTVWEGVVEGETDGAPEGPITWRIFFREDQIYEGYSNHYQYKGKGWYTIGKSTISFYYNSSMNWLRYVCWVKTLTEKEMVLIHTYKSSEDSDKYQEIKILLKRVL